MAINGGKYDNAANAPYWAVSSAICKSAAAAIVSAPTADNVAVLYANTTSGAYISGATIGLFGVDDQEVAVDKKGAHTGWVLRTVGTGQRAGRVQEEVLIAMTSMNNTGGDGDAQVYANVSISLDSTSTATVVYGGGRTATLTVTPTLTGNTSAALTYQWQVNSGGSWTNAVNNTPANTSYSGATSATLTITPTYTNANGYKYRAIVTAADQGVTATSANSTLTVTAS
jgi:hypothetical protein